MIQNQKDDVFVLSNFMKGVAFNDSKSKRPSFR